MIAGHFLKAPVRYRCLPEASREQAAYALEQQSMTINIGSSIRINVSSRCEAD
jgi:hypothetical protein